MSAVHWRLSWNSSMPRPAFSSRPRMSFSSSSGVILTQSDAQRSTPNVPTLLAANQSRKSAVSAKPGKRKNGVCSFSCVRSVGSPARKILAVGGVLDRDHALENVRPRRGVAHVAQRRLRMGVGVVGDGVPFLDLAPRQQRQRVDFAADVEEGRAHAFVGERPENLRRRLGVRPVVEGEDHFVVGERDGLGIGLQADQQAALRADLDDARRAELVGPAFGGRSAAEAGGEQRGRWRRTAWRGLSGSGGRATP